MSKFINTQHKDTIDSLIEGFKEKLNNPYYLYQDKKPAPVTYLSQNLYKSSLDPSSQLTYRGYGDNSSIKLNKINNFYLYGIEKITVDFNVEDFGLEAAPIEGDAVVLPNTIIPVPGDFFMIDHADKNCKNATYVFKVISVTPDTLDNGSNLYKISYSFETTNIDAVEVNIVDEYNFVIVNNNTKFSAVIKKNDFDYIKESENVLLQLKEYYKALFYKDALMTFIFVHANCYFYDPYMIEFIRRHNLMDDGGTYLYIDHQLTMPSTFVLDYDKTFFRYIEMPDKKSDPLIYSQGKFIDEKFSVFDNRIENYWSIRYVEDPGFSEERPDIFMNIARGEYVLNNIDIDLYNRIKSGELYTDNNSKYMNIIIKYFNNKQITGEDIESLNYIDFESNIKIFYNIPIIIYILEDTIKKILG